MVTPSIAAYPRIGSARSSGASVVFRLGKRGAKSHVAFRRWAVWSCSNTPESGCVRRRKSHPCEPRRRLRQFLASQHYAIGQMVKHIRA